MHQTKVGPGQAGTSGRWERRGGSIVLLDVSPVTPPAAGLEREAGGTADEHVRWVQRALNRVAAAGLAVDGRVGPLTTAQVRRFQQSLGLAVDGIAGPVTEAALLAALASATGVSLPGVVAAPCALVDQPSEDLEEFRFDDHRVRPAHQPQLVNLARCIVASQGSARPIRDVYLVGHTDPVGSDAYNFALGLRRAEEVRRRLAEAVDRVRPGLAVQLQFVTNSRGETEPVPDSPSRSRRVAVSVRATTLPPAVCSCPAFFEEYDLRFHPSDEFGVRSGRRIKDPREQDQRVDDVVKVVEVLRSRLRTRCQDALAGRVSPSLPESNPDTVSRAARLSKAQLELFRHCFPDGAGGVNLVAFRHCFERFANGDFGLRTPPRHGLREPDSSAYFFFAEFAFLCIDSGIDAAAWRPLLNVFVQTQEIFMHVYRCPAARVAPPTVTAVAAVPCASPQRTLADFSFSCFAPVGQSDGARRAALRAKYLPMGDSELRAAAADNLVRALCTP